MTGLEEMEEGFEDLGVWGVQMERDIWQLPLSVFMLGRRVGQGKLLWLHFVRDVGESSICILEYKVPILSVGDPWDMHRMR